MITSEHKSGFVEVGTKVTVLKKGDKETRVFLIVGSEESDSLDGKISNESPVGKALLGKVKGDTVTLMTPKGEMIYTIKSIN